MTDDLARPDAKSSQGRTFRWALIALTVVADLLGIGAVVLGLVNQDRINDLIADASGWYVSVVLAEPKSGSHVDTHMVQIEGRIEFQDTAKTSGDVVLALQRRKVDLLPFVRAARIDGWWAQASLLTHAQPPSSIAPRVAPESSIIAGNLGCGTSPHPCGTFTGTVQLGEVSIGIGEQFHIVVLALPKGSVSKGDKSNNLPFSYASSDTATVLRTR